MPDDPFKICFRNICTKLYRQLEDLCDAGALDGGVFTWAKENRRDLYDTIMEMDSKIHDQWDKVQLYIFEKTVIAWRDAVVNVYKEYASRPSSPHPNNETPSQ